jgi:hypothetical protein
MPHNNWCGKPCGECENPCALDESMPCSPDCEVLNKDGTRNTKICIENKCDVFKDECGECPVCGIGDITYGDSSDDDGIFFYK